MHCYAPSFKEVEVANWFGPVRPSIHLPLPPQSSPPQKKKKIILGLDFLCNETLILAPSSHTHPHPLPPKNYFKFGFNPTPPIFFKSWFEFLVKKITYSSPPPPVPPPHPPPTPPPPKFFFFRFGFFLKTN